MPYTFNGCGTRYYGERERAEDGSYITTEWITFVYVPLLPIRSYRVLPVGKGTNILIHRSQSYQTMRVPLCWTQVRDVYLVISPIVLLLVYFNWSDIQTWAKEDVLKSSLPQSTLLMVDGNRIYLARQLFLDPEELRVNVFREQDGSVTRRTGEDITLFIPGFGDVKNDEEKKVGGIIGFPRGLHSDAIYDACTELYAETSGRRPTGSRLRKLRD